MASNQSPKPRAQFFPKKFLGSPSVSENFLGTDQSALRQIKRPVHSPDRVVRMVSINLMHKLLEHISEEGVSVHQLTCITCLDHRTIKKYVDLIIAIQAMKRIQKEQVGLRVLIRREK